MVIKAHKLTSADVLCDVLIADLRLKRTIKELEEESNAPDTDVFGMGLRPGYKRPVLELAIEDHRKPNMDIVYHILTAGLKSKQTIKKLEAMVKDCEEKSEECGGYVLFKNANLQFIETNGFETKINEYFDEYMSGNYSNLKKIFECCDKVISDQKEMGAPAQVIKYMGDILSSIKNEHKCKLDHNKDLRECNVQLLKNMILEHQAVINMSELPLDNPGFLGIYHVHVDEQGPSDKDIELAKGLPFPFYVISNTKGGPTFYCIRQGCPTLEIKVSEGN
jgi:hypothetical protein